MLPTHPYPPTHPRTHTYIYIVYCSEACPAGLDWKLHPLPANAVAVNLSADPLGRPWVVTQEGEVYLRRGVTRARPQGDGWCGLADRGVPFGSRIVQVEGGESVAWAITDDAAHLVRRGMALGLPGGSEWDPVPGKAISLGLCPNESTLWGVAPTGILVLRGNISQQLMPEGAYWEKIQRPNRWASFRSIHVSHVCAVALARDDTAWLYAGAPMNRPPMEASVGMLASLLGSQPACWHELKWSLRHASIAANQNLWLTTAHGGVLLVRQRTGTGTGTGTGSSTTASTTTSSSPSPSSSSLSSDADSRGGVEGVHTWALDTQPVEVASIGFVSVCAGAGPHHRNPNPSPKSAPSTAVVQTVMAAAATTTGSTHDDRKQDVPAATGTTTTATTGLVADYGGFSGSISTHDTLTGIPLQISGSANPSSNLLLTHQTFLTATDTNDTTHDSSSTSLSVARNAPLMDLELLQYDFSAEQAAIEACMAHRSSTAAAAAVAATPLSVSVEALSIDQEAIGKGENEEEQEALVKLPESGSDGEPVGDGRDGLTPEGPVVDLEEPVGDLISLD